jgi:hypothetical protein
MKSGITLAVIVKDEAAPLHRVLTEHRSLYDAAVVVDTGSRDGSPEVAAACGASTYSFSWNDDFSSARNFGLSRVSTTWTLVLDCDEQIAPRDFAAIRALAAGPADVGYVLPQWNYSENETLPGWTPVAACSPYPAAPAAGYVPAFSVRLFPNHPQIRFQGAVHEEIEESLRRRGMVIRQAEVPVHHFGHLNCWGKSASRKSLYGKILRKKIKLKPEDPRTRLELASQLVGEGNMVLARRLLQRTVTEAPGGPEVHRARLLLARLLQESGDFSGAAREATAAVAERPDWLPSWIEAVKAQLLAGQSNQAARYVRQGRRLFPRDQQLKQLEAQVRAPLADNM